MSDPGQKANFMQHEFFPQMLRLFQNYHSAYGREKEFHCQTCHGRSKDDDTDFTKPSLLSPLNPKNMPTKQDPNPRRARITRFMIEQVLPMAKRILNNNELTCFSCHAKIDSITNNVPPGVSTPPSNASGRTLTHTTSSERTQ
jgi:hypothetical protein